MPKLSTKDPAKVVANVVEAIIGKCEYFRNVINEVQGAIFIEKGLRAASDFCYKHILNAENFSEEIFAKFVAPAQYCIFVLPVLKVSDFLSDLSDPRGFRFRTDTRIWVDTRIYLQQQIFVISGLRISTD